MDCKTKRHVAKKKYPVLFYFYSEPAGQTGLNRYGAGINSLYNGNLSDDGYVYVTLMEGELPAPKGRDWRKAIYKKIGQIDKSIWPWEPKQYLKNTALLTPPEWQFTADGRWNCYFKLLVSIPRNFSYRYSRCCGNKSVNLRILFTKNA